MLSIDEIHHRTLERWGGDILGFTTAFFRHVNGVPYELNEHVYPIADKLNRILTCDPSQPRNIIINMPPRSGKTELCILYFVALGFAVNPSSVFMHLSSSDNLVNRNVAGIRDIMLSAPYRMLFPMTQVTNNAAGSIQTSSGGEMYVAPFLGQITGFGCGVYGSNKFSGAMLVDDPVKTQDALSETIRERINFTWSNTIISRKNSEDTPVIIIAQRTHENDLCGYLMKNEGVVSEGGKWDLLELPAIIDDGQETERSYWPSRVSLAELKSQRELNGWVFETQQMQNPKPIEGLLFNKSKTKWYDTLPEDPDFVFMQVDPADEGDNKTCSNVYMVKGEHVYVADVKYTSMGSDYTVPMIVGQMRDWKVSYAVVESNSAWSMYRKEIKRQAAEMGLPTVIQSVTQKSNKELRIFNEAPSVEKYFIYMREDKQDADYKRFMKDRFSYLKLIKNQKDDGVDTDAAASEYLKKNGLISVL